MMFKSEFQSLNPRQSPNSNKQNTIGNTYVWSPGCEGFFGDWCLEFRTSFVQGVPWGFGHDRYILEIMVLPVKGEGSGSCFLGGWNERGGSTTKCPSSTLFS